MAGDIYEAVDSMAVQVDGRDIIINRGTTRVREGHPLLKKYPTLFKPLEVQYDVEQATAAPAEVRAAKPAPAPEPEKAPEPEPAQTVTPEDVKAMEAPAPKKGLTTDSLTVKAPAK